MEFFTDYDFEIFGRIGGSKYRKDSADDEKTAAFLKNDSVYAKTNYWAERLSAYGYEFEMSWHWQNSGTFRHYTWAKVFLPSYSHSRVFFTIGVGSRFNTQNEIVKTLEYKLDCQRKSTAASKILSEAQVSEFDKYVKTACPDAERVVIDIADIANYDWDVLVKETLLFCQKYEEDYKSVVKVIWPHQIGVDQKIARICWNKERWEKPSGPEGKSKGSDEPFEKDKGYGYEEWLFNVEKQLNGYHYGFVQAFNKGSHQGRIYDIMLYSIFANSETKKSEYYWIAHIKELEVLTLEQQAEIYEIYKDKHWMDDMLIDLNNVGVAKFDENFIEPDNMFNVRFKVADDKYVFLSEPQQIVDVVEEIGLNTHYVLLDRKSNSSARVRTTGGYQFREGHNVTQTGSVTVTFPKINYTKSLKHKKIQENIYNQLISELVNTDKKIGTEVPTGMGTMIDLVISCPNDGDTFYEIKTNGSALKCIREALGQLFEYSFYPGKKNANTLIIVAPYPVEDTIRNYIVHLRLTTGINLRYQFYCYDLKQLVGVAI